LKQLFNIENTPSVSGQKVLSLRIGNDHISFCSTDKHAGEIFQLTYAAGNTGTGSGWKEEALAALEQTWPLLKESYYQVLIAYDFPQSVLMPMQQYRLEEGNNLVSSLYGRAAAAVTVAEPVTEWQLMNIYSVPQEVKDWVAKTFPAARQMHQFTVGLKNLQAGEPEGCINLDIRQQDFTILAGKNGKFLLAQTAEYSAPEDILYYLQKIIAAFSLSQPETRLLLSGLVDRESALYRELYQYFIRFEFRDAGWKTREHPAHFFTSLNDLARCVS
jgi:Protein of unknown function (DUF3822)